MNFHFSGAWFIIACFPHFNILVFWDIFVFAPQLLGINVFSFLPPTVRVVPSSVIHICLWECASILWWTVTSNPFTCLVFSLLSYLSLVMIPDSNYLLTSCSFKLLLSYPASSLSYHYRALHSSYLPSSSICFSILFIANNSVQHGTRSRLLCPYQSVAVYNPA